MSLLAVVPDWLQSAAGDLKSIGADLDTAHAAAAAPTTGLVAAGADEVSAAVTALFSEYGQAFHALGAQASTFHTQFVQLLSGARRVRGRGGSQRLAAAGRGSRAAAGGYQWFSPWKRTGRPGMPAAMAVMPGCQWR